MFAYLHFPLQGERGVVGDPGPRGPYGLPVSHKLVGLGPPPLMHLC